jgi:hypothetical protein
MSSEQLEIEKNKYNDACNMGDSAGISQGSSNMHNIIDQNICITQNSVPETNSSSSTQPVETNK